MGFIRAELTGMEDLRARLGGLRQKVRGKILRTAVTKGTRVIKRNVKKRMPVRVEHPQNIDPQKLAKKSIDVKVKTYPSGTVVGLVGPKKGMRTRIGTRVRKGKKSSPGDPIYEDPVKIFHLIENGSRRSKAYHPLRSGLQDSKAEVQAIFASEIRAGLEAAARG